jgi:hypothetical protein
VITAVPADTPNTTPVDALTVAIEVLLLLHAPPDVVFVSVIDELVQTLEGPEFAPTVVLAITVTGCVAIA